VNDGDFLIGLSYVLGLIGGLIGGIYTAWLYWTSAPVVGHDGPLVLRLVGVAVVGLLSGKVIALVTTLALILGVFATTLVIAGVLSVVRYVEHRRSERRNE